MTGRTADGTVFERIGPADAPAIVFIHGLGLNRACWQWTLPALSGRFQLLTYDLFGHGESVTPPETPSLSLFSRQLAALLDHCTIASTGIAGFSLGGMIARRFAQDVPERVAALAILHSAHRRSPEAQAAILKRVEQAHDQGASATVEAALQRWFTEAFRAQNPEMMDLVRGWVVSNRKEIYHRVYRVLAQGIEEILAPTPPLRCPTLVMTGDEDHGNGPEMTRAIAAEIAGAEVRILQQLRHMALAEAPERFNTPLAQFFERALGGMARPGGPT